MAYPPPAGPPMGVSEHCIVHIAWSAHYYNCSSSVVRSWDQHFFTLLFLCCRLILCGATSQLWLEQWVIFGNCMLCAWCCTLSMLHFVISCSLDMYEAYLYLSFDPCMYHKIVPPHFCHCLNIFIVLTNVMEANKHMCNFTPAHRMAR